MGTGSAVQRGVEPPRLILGTGQGLRSCRGVAMNSDPTPKSSSSAEPVQLIALEPRALRRAVLTVLLIVTLWMVELWVYQAISSFLFLLLLSWLFSMAMEPGIA